ncbi:MAG: AIR synthase-related protein, partial [Allosphingosinicella sp.]
RLEAGLALAPLVSAMMDVSDGLLLDAGRIAGASRVALRIDLAAVPLSDACRAVGSTPIAAASAGDDYELLFAAAPERRVEIHILADRLALPLTRIGAFAAGSGLSLSDGEAPVPLPAKLGWEHG